MSTQESVPLHQAETLIDLLRWRALSQPDQRAYSFLKDGETNEVCLTYSELDRQARAIAVFLRSLTSDVQRVLLVYPPGLEYIAAFFGCLYAGVAAIPVYPPRAGRSMQQIQAIAANAQATVALTTMTILSNAKRQSMSRSECSTLQWLTTEDMAPGKEADWQKPEIAGADLAFLQYTSGSTSTPKGVMLSHSNLLQNLALIQQNFEIMPTDSGVLWLPPYHDMGLIGGILGTLYSGNQLTLMSPTSFLQRPLRWLEAISRTKATISGGPNFAYEQCALKLISEQQISLDLSNWKLAFIGAEPIRPETLERFTVTFAPYGFRQEAFYPCYGLAEATLMVSGGLKATPPCIRALQSTAFGQGLITESLIESESSRKIVGCGQALYNHRLVIVDPPSLTECKSNQLGEVWIAGPSVAQGYWNNPEETERTFRAYLSDTGEGPFLRSGDLGFLRDGELFLVDRLKDVIIMRGRNYYPHDIELTVSLSHPVLRTNGSAAFSVTINSKERLVVVQEVERVYKSHDEDEVVGAIRQSVAKDHMLHTYAVVLLKPGSIPKTSSGKIRRHACKEGFLAGTLNVVGRSILYETEVETNTGVLADNALLLTGSEEYRPMLEDQLIREVAHLLAIDPAKLNPQQSLISLGLDSLMAIELNTYLESSLGVILSEESLIDDLSITQVASRVLEQLAKTASTSPPTPVHQSGQNDKYPAPLSRKKVEGNEPAAWLPTSYNQKALWFLYRLAPESVAYNLLYATRIRSYLDVPALQRALQILADRYPILISTYTLQNGEPVQHLQKNQVIPLKEIDAGTVRLDSIKQLLLKESNQPIDLTKGPVLRLSLYRRAENDHVLGFIIHHIAADFWASEAMIDELYLLYIIEKTCMPALPNQSDKWLPQPGFQNADYVRWQQSMLQSQEGERHWHYWQQELAGDLPVLNLPTDRPRPPLQTYKGASHSFSIGTELAGKLRIVAHDEKVTLFVLILAAYQVLLHRYTNQDDILVGTPALGRAHANLERVIGYLANPIIVRTGLAHNPLFKELLSQTKRSVFAALEHQDFPFPFLVERLQPHRDPSYSPIFQTLFAWKRPRKRHGEALLRQKDSALSQRVAEEWLAFEPLVYEQQGALFDLTLTIFEIDGALNADFRYNIDLFDESTLSRMAQHFLTLLASIVDNPDQRIREIPLLSGTDRHKLLVEWNTTQYVSRNDVALHQLIEAQVEKSPEQAALFFEGRTLTYRELNSRANQLAHQLRHAGVKPNTFVGISMERSLEMVVSLLAILKAGGAYVPLDPTYPQGRLAYMIQDARVPVLLTQSHLREHLRVADVTIITVDPDWKVEIAEPKSNLVSTTLPDHLIYMIYTSGSTGSPKGAGVYHRGFMNLLQWYMQEFSLTAQDRVLVCSSFSFDLTQKNIFAPLVAGATLSILGPGHYSPDAIVRVIREQKITFLNCTPSAFYPLPDNAEKEAFLPLVSLKYVILGGEPISIARLWQWITSPHCQAEIVNTYGPTECTDVVAYHRLQEHDCRQETAIPLGKPINNVQMLILDKHLQLLPVGAVGELYIAGESLGAGYLNDPHYTKDCFIANPFNTIIGDRLYKTGDLASYLPDGTLKFVGRVDHQVKIRSFRIELEEIEAELSNHPAIKEAVVIAHEHILNNKRLIAYLVANLNAPHASIEDLRIHLKKKLPAYMIPSVFVYRDSLPLGSNGKVDRKALPIPDNTRPELESAFVPARTQTERHLAAIWAEVLELDKVGIHDNYFDLGGSSLQSLEVLSKATKSGMPLELEMLFEFQTIEELAAAIEERDRRARKKTGTVLPAYPDPAVQKQDLQLGQPFAAIAQAEINRTPKTDLNNMVIESLGTYLPPKIVSSEEIMQNCVHPLRFPLAHLTGIKNRRMAGETEFSLDLAKAAVADCFSNSRYNPEDIDLIICGNISRCNAPGLQFWFEPGTSVQLQHHFGMSNALAFDVCNACAGLFTCMYIAESFLKTGLIRRALVVSGEYISHLILTAQKEIESFMDSRMACLTVGDAGAALILEMGSDTKVGFHEFEMYTSGAYSEACIAKATEREHGGAIMYTDVVQVSTVSMKQAMAHAAYLIERAKWSYADFQRIFVHQTSYTTIKDVARAFNKYYGAEVCNQNMVINNISERANTATTTHMVALMDNIRNNTIQNDESIIFSITGSGATIGTALYTFDDLPDRIRRREADVYTPEKVVPQRDPFIACLPQTRRVRIESIGTLPLNTTTPKETFDLIHAAAENCFTSSTHEKNETDLLIFAGTYRDEFICEPAIAALIAGKLGINADIEVPQQKKTFALDVINAGVAILNACYVVIAMIQAQKANNALIVTSEVENNRDKLPADLYNLEATGSALFLDISPDSKSGFGNFVFKHFAGYIDSLITHTTIRNGKMYLDIQRDPQLESYYRQCIKETVEELLTREQLDFSQIKLILPPQISSDFITELALHLEVSRDKFVEVQSENDLFTSSLAYTLQYVREHQLARTGDVGLIIGVGSGIQVGCAIYYF